MKTKFDTLYLKLINFLVKFYSGTISWKMGKYYLSSVKPYTFIFFLLWGALKVVQAIHMNNIGEGMYTYWAWWDYIMVLLLIPQLLAGFSNFAVNEQKRLNNK